MTIYLLKLVIYTVDDLPIEHGDLWMIYLLKLVSLDSEVKLQEGTVLV